MVEVLQENKEFSQESSKEAELQNLLNKVNNLDVSKKKKTPELNDKELQERAQTERDNLPGVEKVNVSKDLDYVDFEYKGKYDVRYDIDFDVDVLTVKTKGDESAPYVFEFNNSLFDEGLDTPKNKKLGDRQKRLLERIDLCVNAQTAMEEKLAKENVKVSPNTPINLSRQKTYFIGEKKIQKGEEGYKEGKEKTKNVYYSLLQKKKADKTLAFDLQETTKEKYKNAN